MITRHSAMNVLFEKDKGIAMAHSKLLTLTISALILAALLISLGCEKKVLDFECRDPLGCVDLAPGEPLKLGVLQSLSGKTATLGREQIRGLELALDDRQGKILNHLVALQIEDTGCTAEGGANAALKIIADPKHIAIFGTTCSGAAATASRAMSEAGLTMVSGNNSAPFLTAMGNQRAPHWQSGYFRTAANEESSGKAAAIYAYEKLGVRRTASINDGDIYTKGLTHGFNKTFQALGGEVVLDGALNKGDTQMNPLLTAVIDGKAQLLFFPLFQPEGNHILVQAREIPEFKDIVLMGDGALIDSSFLEAVGTKGEGMYFVGPASPKGNAVDLMGKKYLDKYKTAPSAFYFLNAYDAANMLFEGIEKAAVMEEGVIHIGRQTLRDTLYATKQFKGVTGTLSCDEFGDCGVPIFNVLQLEKVSAGLEGLKENVKSTYSPE